MGHTKSSEKKLAFQDDRIKAKIELINITSDFWYDNEYGYSHQVVQLAKYIAKVRRFTYYQAIPCFMVQLKHIIFVDKL